MAKYTLNKKRPDEISERAHAKHHGDDVPGMLAEGGKTHDGENTA